MKKPVRIICNRWFSKTYGNTYFSAYVDFDDNTQECFTKFSYGYGDHCLYVTLQDLARKGLIDLPESYNATMYLREVLNCDYEINDVQRKKDL